MTSRAHHRSVQTIEQTFGSSSPHRLSGTDVGSRLPQILPKKPTVYRSLPISAVKTSDDLSSTGEGCDCALASLSQLLLFIRMSHAGGKATNNQTQVWRAAACPFWLACRHHALGWSSRESHKAVASVVVCRTVQYDSSSAT